jgi:hypothetical protein
VTRVVALQSLSLGGGGGDPDLRAAADIIADGARALSSTWSRQVPGSISVAVGGRLAVISADAGPARPAELRLNHPLFGNRSYWYGPPGEPFLGPAADAKSDAAMARYAEKIDRWAAKAGYR